MTSAVQAQWDTQFGRFDFGLSQEEEKRAKDLHKEAIVIDLLFGNPGGYKMFDVEPFKSRMAKAEAELGLSALSAIFDIVYGDELAGRSTFMRDEWAATGITGAHMGMYADLSKTDERESAHTLTEKLPWLHLAKSVAQIREIKSKGEHFAIGNCQPSMGFPRNLRVIEKAYAGGLRSLMLSYNYSNGVACGCTERIDHAITSFGVDVIAECNRLGIIVDTSHVGRASTIDACKLSKKPVTANHTCVGALSGHARGKSDDEIKAVADTGGIVGLCWIPYFYSKTPKTADVRLFLDHIDYIAELVGPEYIAIGSDGPVSAPKDLYDRFISSKLKELAFRPEDNIQVTVNFIGLDDYRDFINITRGLVKRGYSDAQIKGILGENYLRVFGQNCG